MYRLVNVVVGTLLWMSYRGILRYRLLLLYHSMSAVSQMLKPSGKSLTLI